MGRLAAVAWALLGAALLLGELAPAREQLGYLLSGYGVSDARTVLLGLAIGGALGACALVAAAREWRGERASLWLVLPAAVALFGAILLSGGIGRPWEFGKAVGLFAFPIFGAYGLVMGIVPALAYTLLVRFLDARLSGGSSAGP